MNRKRFNKTVAISGGSLLLSYAVLVGLLEVSGPAWLEDFCRPRGATAFSSDEWAKTRSGNSARYRMANDVVRSGVLMGLSQQEVPRLLGEPDRTYPVDSSTALGYDLASQHEFPSGCVLLPSNLFFNTETWLLEVRCHSGRVVAVRIRHT